VQVDLLRHAELVREPFPVWAEDAAGVRFVEHQRGAVALLQRDELDERATSPSIEKTESVTISLRSAVLAASWLSRWSRSRWR